MKAPRKPKQPQQQNADSGPAIQQMIAQMAERGDVMADALRGLIEAVELSIERIERDASSFERLYVKTRAEHERRRYSKNYPTAHSAESAAIVLRREARELRAALAALGGSGASSLVQAPTESDEAQARLGGRERPNG